MPRAIDNKNIKREERRSFVSRQAVRTTSFVSVNKGEVIRLRADRGQENGSWDDTVTQLIEEYDELWQRLADA